MTMNSMKFSLINDSGNLINFSDLDPLYINWLNKDLRQNSYQLTPSIILTGSRYTSSVSYNHFLSSNSNVNIFGNSIFLNFSYDIVSNLECSNNSGFIQNSEDFILPNYFEPLEIRNIDIDFAYKSNSGPLSILRGDSDQDRPNS